MDQLSGTATRACTGHDYPHQTPYLGVCAVGGCANSATHVVSIPCRVDGFAGELDGVYICDDHTIEPWFTVVR